MSTGEATKHRLLDAAEVLFARRDYAATSVRDITQAARCNIASVNYHFGSKQNLYEQMFDRLLERLRAQREGAMAEVMARPRVKLEQVLRRYAEVFLDLMADNPEECQQHLALFMREMTEPHLPRGMMFKNMIGPTKQMLRRAFTRMCPGMDDLTIDLCIHSVVGQLLHVLHARAMLAHAGVDDAPILDTDRAVDHIVRFSDAAMKALAKKGRHE